MAPLSKKVIAWVATGIFSVSVALVVVLWWAGTSGLEGEELVTARFDALRTGLSIGLGGGGLFALYLAWRRQHSTEIGLTQKQQDQADVARAYELQRETFDATRQHQERVAAATERDAEARRITDLYTKAVEQLGSEKAPVRLGGLYALERLAQDHVEQRQTIVNVLCAYLRMPYTLPGEPPPDDADDQLVTAHRERIQEREVRLAAQRILTHHLRSGDDPHNVLKTFWTGIEIDLTNAALINFNLTHCNILNAQFSLATFTGHATFDDVTFDGNATFEDATFDGNATLDNATFTGNATFRNATFTNGAWFQVATFMDRAIFNNATFAGQAAFKNATFRNATSGNSARKSLFRLLWSESDFSNTKFAREVTFNGATFTGGVTFKGAIFEGNVDLENATFEGRAGFSQATLPDAPYNDDYDGRRRGPWLDGRGARFELGVPRELERFVSQPEEEAINGGEAG
jgi:uncharacterized protein YjbI with pentapeptide repeats